jgi:NADPH:quinone reductase-like Zn-dependent oxidoreductase
MKAVIHDAYGGPEVLKPAEVPRPTPGLNDIRVRVHATSVTSGDLRLRAFDIPPLFWLPARLGLGITRPRHRILGTEFAGVVDEVGEAVARWKPGDRVFGARVFGSYAEYKCLPEGAAVAAMPANLSFAEAAAIPFGALTALHFLRKAGIGAGRRVLINGAAGGVGLFAVQLARHDGAEVTAVCAGRDMALVRSLGAERVIDYTREDFTQGSATYDILLDTAGTTTFAGCRRVLTPQGVHVFLVAGLGPLLRSLWTPLTGGRRVVAGVAPENPADLETIRELAEGGALRPVIDRTFPLEQAAEAHAYAESGARRGQVVIRPDPGPGE